MALEWDFMASSWLRHFSSEEMSLVCDSMCVFLRGASVHLCAVLFLSDEMRMRLETCIICNRYHSLMVSVLPLAAHNGPFFWGSWHLVRLFDGDGMGTVGVTWEETRRTMGPFIYLLLRKLAFLALDMVSIQRALVQGVADNRKGKNRPSKEKHFILPFTLQKQRITMSHIQKRNSWLSHQVTVSTIIIKHP